MRRKRAAGHKSDEGKEGKKGEKRGTSKRERGRAGREEERKLVGSSTSEHSRERERERGREGETCTFGAALRPAATGITNPKTEKEESKVSVSVCLSAAIKSAWMWRLENPRVLPRRPQSASNLKFMLILKSKSKKHQNRKSKNRKPSVWFVVVCIFQAAPRHSDFRALVFCWYVHVSVSAYFRQPPFTPTGRPLAKGNFPWPHRAG